MPTFGPEDASVQRRIREIGLEARREAAFRHMEAKNWKAALAAFSDLARDSEPGDRQASYQLHIAYCHQPTGPSGPGGQGLHLGAADRPGSALGPAEPGLHALRLSRYREAAEQWEQLPAHQKPHRSISSWGVCYLHLARYDRAEAAFRQSLEGGNRSPQLLYNLGSTLLRRFKTAEGWALIRRSAAANYPPAHRLLRRAGLTGR